MLAVGHSEHGVGRQRARGGAAMSARRGAGRLPRGTLISSAEAAAEICRAGLWPSEARAVGGRGSFPARKSLELLQELLQWARYRLSSLLGLPVPPAPGRPN